MRQKLVKYNATIRVGYTVCPIRYRTRHFFCKVTTGWRTAAPCRNN